MLFLILYSFIPGDVDQAIAAMKTGDYQTAYDIFLPMAESGDVQAVITIANMYFEGSEGFPRDYEKALDWNLRAIEHGSLYGYNNAGVIFRDGLGVNQDLVFAAGLFGLVTQRGRENPGAAELARRNNDKLLMMASAEQLARAERLGPDDLTIAEINRRRRSDAPGSPAQAADLLDLDDVSTRYTPEKADPGHSVEIVQVREEKRDERGYISDLLERSLPDNTFRSPNDHFVLEIPSFIGGETSVIQRTLRDGVDNQVRLEEKNGKRIVIAVVVTTRVPEDQEVAAAAVLAWAERQQRTSSDHLPRGTVDITRARGPWGDMVQVAVVNRIPSEEYPGSRMKTLPPKDGLKGLGLNRIGLHEGYVVEVGVILFDEGSPETLISAAEQHLNRLMGALELL